MDFAFSEEQELLRSQARDFLDRESDSRRVRELMEADGGVDAAKGTAMYSRIAELGWTAMPFPEAVGGLGLGVVDLTVVLEELGRHVTPTPFHSTVCLAGTTLLAADEGALRTRLLAGIADGSLRATLALVEASGRWEPSSVRLRARADGGGVVLDGEKLYVSDAHAADWIIVIASDGDGGITLAAIERQAPGVSVEPLLSMDRTRPLHRVRLEGVRVGADAVVASGAAGLRALRHGLRCAAVAVSAELCGVAERAMEMSVEYAKTRRQFGRPIGSYQAVSHRCADMLVAVESAKSLTYHAAWALDSDAPEAALAVSMAKAYASDAARGVTGSAIQVHGGIGFTWEHDAHLYFKRAKWGEVAYGDARHHRELVADLLEL